MVDSKAKGAAYEQKIVTLLRKELGIQFHRTPHSGALEYFKGDILVPSDTAGWPFAIEAKHYAALDFSNFLTAKSNDILQFWTQTTTQANTMKKKPLLIFRFNRSKDYVAYDDFSIECESYHEVRSFGHHFKIVLLTEWLEAYKKILKEAGK